MDTGSRQELPQQRLPVWLIGPGDLYQLVNVCEFYTVGNYTALTVFSPMHSVVDCGSPLSISNGSPEPPTTTTLEGMVTYTCVSGYEVSNGVTTAMATCMASGMWEPVPTCSSMYFHYITLHD